ncbi:MAG: D-glycerate dehydrogenase [Candidatus Taylorbacteria bacterium]|nr:D-glycerate dehydrogenase [Candidatus Taylorbacteria bacterium]
MKVYITRQIPEVGIKMLRDKGFEVDINPKDRPLTKKELIKALTKKPYEGVLTLLTDTIDADVMDACPRVKIFANYAIGFNNFNIEDAKKRGVILTNTPGGGADRVAEHTWALILALTCRIVEGDSYIRNGKYKGWDPMLLHGTKLAGKTLGIIGTGRIGADVAHKAKNGFGMSVVYYDIVRNEKLEQDFNAVFYPTVEEVLRVADVVSIHVPLTDATHHLMNEARFGLMKKTAYLVNTSRGPVIDENALVFALQNGLIAGAGIDVFEFEPKLAKGLAKLPNVVLTPHIASATDEARLDMATISAQNIINVLEGKPAISSVI